MQREKPRYWSKRLPKDFPATEWDTVVIGSGMGGMTTASLLAKLGHKVLVLEQHYVPGGFTHTFTRKGYTWDVGVHAVGEVTDASMTGRLLKDLSGGKLEWTSLGPVYDEFYWPARHDGEEEFRIDFPDTPDGFRNNLIAAFPNEVEAIDTYLRLVREVAGAMKGYYMARIVPNSLAGPAEFLFARTAQKWLTKSTGEVVNALTDDPALRAVMTAQWGYYGSLPENSSFAMQALVVKHFLWGGYYPRGGSGEIAQTLLKTVADAGGWTRIVAPVQEILVENGRAVGVRMDDGEEIRAKRVVSAAGVVSTVKRLLPEAVKSQPWAKEAVSGLAAASAHLCLYIGFKGDITKVGASAANKWFYRVYSSETDSWEVREDGVPETAPCLYTSFPSLKDPDHDPGPEVRHTGEVVTFVPWSVYEKWSGTTWRKRGEDYDAFKEMVEKALLADFLKCMPELEPLIDYVELSTPISTETFCRPIEGSIYGIEPTPERFENDHLKPRARLPGLFFSGSEVTTVGVMGAMMGGVLCAAAIEPMGVFNHIRKLG
ncbi:MAG: NAD(P)/FAD-dependent oxidoreductase [Proteobacteria bacterium]|nr:NAD(P)/FAD-dependent oxidoreductase [Pseudomonadota bacterium]MCP4921513.1 NAD(P)/FAD-dependent oxidoreductase [Pseudomonadota bacterium]